MNIGVIGLGSWGSRVFPEYKQLEKEGIIDNALSCDVEKNADFSDYKELIKHCQGVHICLPNKFHYEIAKDILKAGVHVLVEKPMTYHVNEAFELSEIASEQGTILQVGYIMRFANVLRKLKELYDQKYFGNMHYCTLHWTAYTKPMHGAEIVWDLLPHPLDIIYFLTGKFPKEWNLITKPIRREKYGELALVNLDYGSFMAQIELSWVTQQRRRRLKIWGDSAGAKADIVAQKIKVIKDGDVSKIPVEANNTILAEAENFIESISKGRSKFNSHIVGIRNTDTIEKMMREYEFPI